MEPTPETNRLLIAAAEELADRLKACDVRIVFAESCTAGLVSATLARIPGISNHLCGSAVTYREDTKIKWINVEADSIKDPGVVSHVVAAQMASGVLNATPEAQYAVAITGHLGPNAPADLDGVVFVGTASHDTESQAGQHKLPAGDDGQRVRIERQYQAATVVLKTACDLVSSQQ